MAALIFAQVCLVLASAMAAKWLGGWPDVAASCFGGSIAVLNALLLARRLQSSLRAADHGNRAALHLYLGAVERFLLTIVGFAIGLSILKLPAVAMLATFALTQIAYLIASRSDYAIGGMQSKTT